MSEKHIVKYLARLANAETCEASNPKGCKSPILLKFCHEMYCHL